MNAILKAKGGVIEAEPKNGKFFTSEELQAIVGGYFVILFIDDGNHILVLNENDKECPWINSYATYLAWQHRAISREEMICGDVLLCERPTIH